MKKNKLKNAIKNLFRCVLEETTFFDKAFFIYITLTAFVFPMLDLCDITNPTIDCLEIIVQLIFIFYVSIKVIPLAISYLRD